MENGQKGGRRERNRREKRRTILDAAAASFLSNGYAGTSMSALVTVIGGSKETLWSHFRSKDALFEAVIDDVTTSFHGELAELLAPGRDLRETVRDFCRALLARLQAPATLAAWRLVTAESARSPIVGQVFLERAIRPTEAALAALFGKAIAQGQLCDDDPLVMASMLLGLCWGRESRIAWSNDADTASSIDIHAERYSDWFLRVFQSPSAAHGRDR